MSNTPINADTVLEIINDEIENGAFVDIGSLMALNRVKSRVFELRQASKAKETKPSGRTRLGLVHLGL